MADGGNRLFSFGKMLDNFENIYVKPQIFRCTTPRNYQRVILFRLYRCKRRIQREIMAPFFAVGLVAFEIVHGCPHLLAAFLHKTGFEYATHVDMLATPLTQD